MRLTLQELAVGEIDSTGLPPVFLFIFTGHYAGLTICLWIMKLDWTGQV